MPAKALRSPSAAGMAKTHLGSVMVAMIVRADRPNSYGQQILETEGDWLRAFQTRPRMMHFWMPPLPSVRIDRFQRFALTEDAPELRGSAAEFQRQRRGSETGAAC